MKDFKVLCIGKTNFHSIGTIESIVCLFPLMFRYFDLTASSYRKYGKLFSVVITECSTCDFPTVARVVWIDNG